VAERLLDLIGHAEPQVGDPSVAEIVVDIPDGQPAVGFVAVVLDASQAAAETPEMPAPAGLYGSSLAELVDGAIHGNTARRTKKRQARDIYGPDRVGGGRQPHLLTVETERKIAGGEGIPCAVPGQAGGLRLVSRIGILALHELKRVHAL